MYSNLQSLAEITWEEIANLSVIKLYLRNLAPFQTSAGRAPRLTFLAISVSAWLLSFLYHKNVSGNDFLAQNQ